MGQLIYTHGKHIYKSIKVYNMYNRKYTSMDQGLLPLPIAIAYCYCLRIAYCLLPNLDPWIKVA